MQFEANAQCKASPVTAPSSASALSGGARAFPGLGSWAAQSDAASIAVNKSRLIIFLRGNVGLPISQILKYPWIGSSFFVKLSY